MKKTIFAIIYFIFFQNILFANPNFPELTGRVIDEAQILSRHQENSLTTILQNHEEETSNQIIIVILNSLEGYEIEDFSYKLGRHWGIGQKDKNNGVLLVISMQDKKIRIEVGYGLEGSLTDKISHEIIEYILKPSFRQGNFYTGINKATKAIIEAIQDEYTPSDYGVLSDSSENLFFLYFAIIFLSAMALGIAGKFKNNTLSKLFYSSFIGGFGSAFAIGFFNISSYTSFILFLITVITIFFNTKKVSLDQNNQNGDFGKTYSSGGGFSGGSFGGGSFGGGGGSFGGGGASGGW